MYTIICPYCNKIDGLLPLNKFKLIYKECGSCGKEYCIDKTNGKPIIKTMEEYKNNK
jgi:hypothetical protein